jgi:hypothetical protein
MAGRGIIANESVWISMPRCFLYFSLMPERREYYGSSNGKEPNRHIDQVPRTGCELGFQNHLSQVWSVPYGAWRPQQGNLEFIEAMPGVERKCPSCSRSKCVPGVQGGNTVVKWETLRIVWQHPVLPTCAVEGRRSF